MLKDSPGSLNFTMFLALLGDHLQVYSAVNPASTSNLLRAFEQFDLQRTGRVEVAALKEILTSTGDRMSEEEVDDVLRDAPKADSEGHFVDYKEFIRLIKAPF